MTLQKEVKKRRTFAIISHPDAGKTTLTEKFLLFGGAIQTAGAVKSNKIQKAATSDFMEIERQRGISVATSVMGFDYQGHKVNILDTPGHKDFAEDTYRTLSAVDSVILVVDSVKGVEEQTENLMRVCRMRNTPVIVFINKMDREGKDAFDLLDELEEKLAIKVCPLTWPISQGVTFQGVYNMYAQQLNLFAPHKTKLAEEIIRVKDIFSEDLSGVLPEKYIPVLREEVELVQSVYGQLLTDRYLQGEVAPVFFGSAINNFGVQELLETFIKIAPCPNGHPTNSRNITALEPHFSGFVFKIQANLDPKHRDRVAFVRVCSGKFQRNEFYYHTRLQKKVRFSNPTSFMANTKSIIEDAWPGDIVGVYDTGNLKIGDSLTEGEDLFFKGIPSFSPEILKEVVNQDPFKTKQLEKGLKELSEEGVAQLFTQQPGNRKIIGTVGELQFEVITFRLLHEYGATCSFRSLNVYKACWVQAEDKNALNAFLTRRAAFVAYDKSQNPVYLAESKWDLKTLQDAHPKIKFIYSSENFNLN